MKTLTYAFAVRLAANPSRRRMLDLAERALAAGDKALGELLVHRAIDDLRREDERERDLGKLGVA